MSEDDVPLIRDAVPDARLKSRFPGICRAALAIVYDNGGINRDRSEVACLQELVVYLKEYWLSSNHSGLRTILYSHLREIDNWLNNLSDEVIDIVCAGEEMETAAVLVDAPRGTGALLNGIFENVC